jgi:FlaA1/EpsC-like NDP-sugar epimerase
MVKLYGMEPGKDIDIIYTGPRHGEKINEELVADDEELVKTEFGYIFEAKNNNKNQSLTNEKILGILFSVEKEIQIYDYNNLFRDIRKIIPEFDENEIWYKWE